MKFNHGYFHYFSIKLLLVFYERVAFQTIILIPLKVWTGKMYQVFG